MRPQCIVYDRCVRVFSLLVSIALGCGRIGFDGDVASGPFGPATPIVELDSGADDDPTLTQDMREICFDSNRAGGLGAGDIWCATRASTGDPFGTPFDALVLNTDADETTPEFSPDGLALYFASARAGSAGGLDIYLATRTSRDAGWIAPVRVGELSSPLDDTAAVVLADNTTIYVGSHRDGSDALYIATRAAPELAWSPPVVTDIPVGSFAESQYITPDGTVLVDALGGDGVEDLFVAQRASLADPFGELVPIGELNTTANDTDPWLASDGRTLVFASSRDGANRIYITTR
jgi:Tol biopolymer transport system component